MRTIIRLWSVKCPDMMGASKAPQSNTGLGG